MFHCYAAYVGLSNPDNRPIQSFWCEDGLKQAFLSLGWYLFLPCLLNFKILNTHNFFHQTWSDNRSASLMFIRLFLGCLRGNYSQTFLSAQSSYPEQQSLLNSVCHIFPCHYLFTAMKDLSPFLMTHGSVTSQWRTVQRGM